MGSVNAPGISAAPLSLIFIYIDPAVSKSFFQKIGIFLPQRSKSLFHNLFCFLKRIGTMDAFHHGSIQIIHMDLRKIQSLPAEPDVPVQKGKVTADSLNQIIINGLRHLILCQRMGPAGGVIPYSGIKNRLFHLSAVNGSHRVPVLAVYAVEAAEGIFPHSPVRG